ncbi:MAG: hypothetical protein QW279_09605 [Candidatus Jordarchaeaceae archaeon]
MNVFRKVKVIYFLVFILCIFGLLILNSPLLASEVDSEVSKDEGSLCNKEQAKRIFKIFFGPNLLKKVDIKEVNTFKISNARDINICEVVYTLDQRENKNDPLLIQILYYGEDFIITGFVSKIIDGKVEQITKQRFTFFNYDLLKGAIHEVKEAIK